MEDTIAAISTPLGTGGIGIIRISGKYSFTISEKIFMSKKNFAKIKSHTINFGKIINPDNGKVIDEVLLTKMKGPKTFTKEDVVEINCHGGIIVIKEILELILKQGVRLAEPGEFTKRAFLNGRLDLSQAEAVIDIINSKSSQSKKAALDQLEGKLSKYIREIRNQIVNFLARIEVKIDYPEYDVEEVTRNELIQEISRINDDLKKFSQSYDRGRLLKEGIRVAIAGRPNVGKSSLLNELIGKNRAIVTDIPGTTRDTIEELINIKGIPVKLVDTAGIRETEDFVEKIGIENSLKTVNDADILIYIISAVDDAKYDYELLDGLNVEHKIIFVNKIDLGFNKAILDELTTFKMIKASVKDKVGIDALEEEIDRIFNSGKIDLSNEIIITNLRHKKLIDDAAKILENVIGECENLIPVDLLAIEITEAADLLGQIIGESVKEDIINEIFKNFCLGK